MPGIYIHIPFCKKACNYCDFHFSTNLTNKQNVVTAIVNELGLRKDYINASAIDTIYFGGGTPSILSEDELVLILTAINSYFNYKPSIEITLEANPDDINETNLQIWKRAGVNRLSIGLQSFNNDELKWMNRVHTAEESLRCVKLAHDFGFDNITIDLIYGSKFQDLKSWETTLQQAVNLNTTHISSYNLTIENKTELGNKYSKGIEPAINDDLSSRQFLLMTDMLQSAGFIHYEISNFGKEGHFAKHNSNYWLGHNYLGLGPSAHSYNGKSRQWNIKHNAQYVSKISSGDSFFEEEELTLKDLYNEYVLTRLRTIWGCSLQEIKDKFGVETLNHFNDLIKQKHSLVKEDSGIYTLTNAGKLQADGIAADLFLV